MFSLIKLFFKIIFYLLGLALLTGLGIGIYLLYQAVFSPLPFPAADDSKIIYIPSGSGFETVAKILLREKIISSTSVFYKLAEVKKYRKSIKPGRYRIKKHTNLNALINLLRSGAQEPVEVVFNNVRTKKQLVTQVCRKLEADSITMLSLLNNNQYLKNNFGLTRENVLVLFIPNTYELYWTTSADEFLARMAREYKQFWTEDRKEKAKMRKLSQTQVAILASIVQAEQSRFDDEKPAIAGLYLNRLKRNIPLQADPTLVYAAGDFGINRVLNVHKDIDSPYNTYLHTGLPPGPICLPEISSLDAVLNAEDNDFIYMCAKEDFSGKHNFSKTLEQHNACAARFRRALDAANIKK